MQLISNLINFMKMYIILRTGINYYVKLLVHRFNTDMINTQIKYLNILA